MSVEIVPAKRMIICDRCGACDERGKHGGKFYLAGMHGSYESWGTSWNGDVGGTTINFDFCQDCSAAFDEWKAAGKFEMTEEK